jgi:hypothetical protein
VVLDYQAIRASVQISDITSQTEPSLWRYLPLLPVSDPGFSSTPLHMAVGRRFTSLSGWRKSWACSSCG